MAKQRQPWINISFEESEGYHYPVIRLTKQKTWDIHTRNGVDVFLWGILNYIKNPPSLVVETGSPSENRTQHSPRERRMSYYPLDDRAIWNWSGFTESNGILTSDEAHATLHLNRLQIISSPHLRKTTIKILTACCLIKPANDPTARWYPNGLRFRNWLIRPILFSTNKVFGTRANELPLFVFWRPLLFGPYPKLVTIQVNVK